MCVLRCLTLCALTRARLHHQRDLVCWSSTGEAQLKRGCNRHVEEAQPTACFCHSRIQAAAAQGPRPAQEVLFCALCSFRPYFVCACRDLCARVFVEFVVSVNRRRKLCRSWEKLADAIQQIFDENAGDLSFEELYRTGYNMVLHKFGDVLYNNVEAVLKDRSCLLCEKVDRNTDET